MEKRGDYKRGLGLRSATEVRNSLQFEEETTDNGRLFHMSIILEAVELLLDPGGRKGRERR